MHIVGHCALVAGGGSGLGAESAPRLAGAGAKLAVLDVNLKGEVVRLYGALRRQPR